MTAALDSRSFSDSHRCPDRYPRHPCSYSDVWHSAEKCHPRGLAKEANTVRETFQVSAPQGKENDSGTSSTPKFCQATPRLRLAWHAFISPNHIAPTLRPRSGR